MKEGRRGRGELTVSVGEADGADRPGGEPGPVRGPEEADDAGEVGVRVLRARTTDGARVRKREEGGGGGRSDLETPVARLTTRARVAGGGDGR